MKKYLAIDYFKFGLLFAFFFANYNFSALGQFDETGYEDFYHDVNYDDNESDLLKPDFMSRYSNIVIEKSENDVVLSPQISNQNVEGASAKTLQDILGGEQSIVDNAVEVAKNIGGSISDSLSNAVESAKDLLGIGDLNSKNIADSSLNSNNGGNSSSSSNQNGANNFGGFQQPPIIIQGPGVSSNGSTTGGSNTGTGTGSGTGSGGSTNSGTGSTGGSNTGTGSGGSTSSGGGTTGGSGTGSGGSTSGGTGGTNNGNSDNTNTQPITCKTMTQEQINARITQLDSLISSSPTNISLIYEKGMMLFCLGDFKKSGLALAQINNINPSNASSLLNNADNDLVLERFGKVLDSYNESPINPQIMEMANKVKTSLEKKNQVTDDYINQLNGSYNYTPSANELAGKLDYEGELDKIYKIYPSQDALQKDLEAIYGADAATEIMNSRQKTSSSGTILQP